MQENPFYYAAFLVAGLLIGYFVTNWYHKINKRVRIQQSQLFLLSKMAEQSGVSQEDIYKSFNHAEGSVHMDELFKKTY